MDFKQTLATLGWVAKNAKLSGTDFRVLVLLASEANYKTGKVAMSYGDAARALGISSVAATMSIKRLEAVGVLVVTEQASGRASAQYKIRTVEQLRILHERETVNADRKAWDNKKYELFGDFEIELSSIGHECHECLHEDGGGQCPRHEYQRKTLLESDQGRAMRLWIDENPAPPFLAKTVAIIKPGRNKHASKK